MSDIVGYGGQFAGPTGVSANWAAWSATVEDRIASFATFSSRWLNNKQTVAQISGSASGVLVTDASPIPTLTTSDTVGANLTTMVGIATLTATDGCTITGNFVFTNVVLNRDMTDAARITANFVSDGPVSIVWTTV